MKKLSAISVFCFFALSLFAQRTVFYDDFSSNKNNWLQSTSGNSIYVINNGKMNMENTTETAVWVGQHTAIGPGNDYSISVSTAHTGGVDSYAYGIYFGALDGQNGYAFQISANGYYILNRYENGQISNLISWTKTSYVNTGNYVTNELRIAKEGVNWKLYINNNLITSTPAQKPFGDITGLNLGNKQRVEFDNLTVTETTPAVSNDGSTGLPGSGSLKELFSDDFSSNKNSWSTGQTDEYSTAINNGKFVMEGLKADKSCGAYRTIEVDQSKDYTFSVSAMHTSGVVDYGFGLFFGGTNMDNSFRFIITSNGYYMLSKFDNGTFSKLIEYTKSDAVNTGNYTSNELTLKKTGSTWYLYVNNKYVNSYAVQPFFGSKIGLYVSNMQRVEFDNLKISGGTSLTPGDPLSYDNTNYNNSTTTTPLPDYTGGPKIKESGKLCDMFSKITREGPDRFKKLTGALITESKYTRTNASTLTVTEAAKAYIEHGSTYSTFKIDFGEYKTLAEAVAKLEQIKPLLEKCAPGNKIMKSAGSTQYGSTYYLTEKSATGFKKTGYYMGAVIHTVDNVTTYTATLTIPDKVYPETFTYLTNTPVNSDFSKNLKYLMQEAKTNFSKLKGDKIATGEKESYYYKSTYTMPGTGYCELEDLWGVMDFDAYFGSRIGSEQAAKLAFNDLVKKVKDALGKNYMFTQSELTNSNTFTFYQKDNFTDSEDMVEVELFKGNDGTYDVILIVVGAPDDDDGWF